MRIKHNAFVVIADGSRAVIAQNVGTALAPRLETRATLDAGKIPLNREIGSDRPDRVHESTSARRSSVELTDRHTLAESRFLTRVANALEQFCGAKEFREVILIAAPRALAVLREALPDCVRNKTVAEIDKDLTRLPVPEVEGRLATL